MKKLTLVLALIAAVLPLLAQRPPAGPPRIRTLIITGQEAHDWRSVTPGLRKALDDTKRFDVRVTEEFRGAGPETLANYDLVVLNYRDSRPEHRWGERADKALLDFVRSGKGLVMFHFSVAAFVGWEEYEKLSGGNWRPNQGHHSAAHDFTVFHEKHMNKVVLGSLPKRYLIGCFGGTYLDTARRRLAIA